jgi:hypothetical protein
MLRDQRTAAGGSKSKERTMYSIKRIKAAAATLTVGFLLATASTATAQAANGTRFGMTPQQWKAEQIRATELNRYYQLGADNPATKVRTAEGIRAQELNRRYKLGKYAVIEASTPFDWGNVGIGAGAMLGAILVAGGLGVTLRRRPERLGDSALGGVSGRRLR